MGASCVGKAQRPEPRKPDNKSNTLSSEGHSREEAVGDTSKQLPPSPSPVLLSYRPQKYPMPSSFRVPHDRLTLHREYRYQELFQFRTQNKFASSCSIAEFVDRRQETAREEWWQCSNLERDSIESKACLLGGTTFAKQTNLQQLKQKGNKMGQSGKQDIRLTINSKAFPKKIVVVNVEMGKDACFEVKHQCYHIEDEQDIQILLKKSSETHPFFEYFTTPFLSGMVFTQKTTNSQHQTHFLNHLFDTKQQIPIDSLFLLYTNEIEHIPRNPVFGKMTKYFEISNVVKQYYGDIWHCSLPELQKIVQKDKLDSYIAVQMLRCIVDSLERQFLVSGRYAEKREELTESRVKAIHHFLTLEQSVVRIIHFLANIILVLQGISDQDRKQRAQNIVKVIAFELPTITDGLFFEFGFEVNEKQHFFRLESSFFLKYRSNKKQIRHLNKNITYPHPPIINSIKQNLLHLSTSPVTQANIQAIRTQFLFNIQEKYRQMMTHRINILFAQDFLMRLKLLHFYIDILQGRPLQQQWKQIQDNVATFQLMAPQTILFFLTIGGLASTALKIKIERTQAEEFFYLKALQMAHKMYGDPRANRACMTIEQEQAWQLLILENYSSLFKGSFEKREFHYLNNIADCLKEDLKKHWQQESIGNNLERMERMMKCLPIKTLSGHFYQRAAVFDAENEEIRSNYSQSLSSSSSSKRTNRASYKINESQFSLKLSLHSGIIRWGQSIAAPPHILAPLKNKQVIAIASGNYHTIFLTEQGVFGWGQNHSFQLGTHNKQKVYLKEPVCLQKTAINRNKDRFQLSCGNQHSAILINGLLHMWGQTQGGILGGNGHIFDMISCGGLHTLAIRQGIVFSWGRGQGGQLGHPLSDLRQKRKEETTQFFIDAPTAIMSIPASAIKVACGDAHSLVLTSQGKVFVFGFSYQGQLGLGMTGESETFQVFQPLQHTFFKERVVDVFAGPTFSFFKTEKEVYSCGMNDCLQLGIDRALKVFQKKKYLNRTTDLSKKKVGEQEFSKPRKIDMFGGQFGVTLIQLECGENHCLTLVRYMGQETMLMGWGLNRHFQIDASLPQWSTPRTLEAFYTLSINQICCGSTFSLASIGSLAVTDRQLSQQLEDAMSSTSRL